MDRKRHLSSDEGNQEVNEICPPKKVFVDCQTSGLLTLPDDLLLLIFSYLTTSDYLRLMKTSQRLQCVAMDSSLWKYVDTSDYHISNKELRRIIPLLSKRTNRIVINGGTNNCTVTDDLMDYVSKVCSELTGFSLNSCYVDTSQTSILKLPPSVRHFGIVDCQLSKVPIAPSIFLGMCNILPALTTLDLTGAKWMPHHSLQAVAKCQNLQKLCLADCWHVGDTVAYTAIAVAGGGFKSLKWLDLRGTSVSTHELAFFTSLPKIECLYVGRTTEKPIVFPSGGEGNGIIENSFYNIFCNDNQGNKFKELGLSYTSITENILRLFLLLPLEKLYYHGDKSTNFSEDFATSKILTRSPIPTLDIEMKA